MNQIIKKTIKTLLAAVFVFAALGILNSQKARAWDDAYVTYENVVTTTSCAYIPIGIICLNDNWYLTPDTGDDFITITQRFATPNMCPAGSSFYAFLLEDECTGSFFCSNSSIPDPYLIEEITQVYTCHYIDAVLFWSDCIGGVQTATEVRWATVPGTSCSNVPLTRPCDCIPDCSCAADTCVSLPCTDSNCGTTCNGTKDCGSIYSCTGGPIPSNASLYANDDTDLSFNTPYTYSATDTSPKCQYHCNAGYSWNGSSCVAAPITTFTGTWYGGTFTYPPPYPHSYSGQYDRTTINIPIPYSSGSRTYGPFRIYLDWSVANATGGNCTGYSTSNLSGWSSSGTSGKPITGNDVRVDVSRTTEFYLDCEDADGAEAERKTVRVNILNSTMPTLTLTALPTTVDKGGSTTLTWTVNNASSCTATGDWTGAKLATNGVHSELVGPLNEAREYVYKMQCRSADGTLSPLEEAKVIVIDCPSNDSCADTLCDYETCTDSCLNIHIGKLSHTCFSWSDCSKTCGGGTQTRNCICPDGPETQSCNTQPCAGAESYHETTP